MMNLKYKSENGQGVVLAVVVAGAKSGKPLALGSAGLFGVAVTDTATAALRAVNRAAAGLKDGEASISFPGVGQVLDLGAIPNGVNNFDKLYQDATTGALTATSAGNLWIGWRINSFVGIRNNA